jgi:hypothetical protein
MFATATKKPCPFCGKRIQSASFKCMFCGEFLSHVAGWAGGDGSAAPPEVASTVKQRGLVPEGYCGWAVAVGYLGVLALVPAAGLLFGLFALAAVPIAFRKLNRDPVLRGKNWVVVGLVLAAVGTLFNIFVVAKMVLNHIAEHSGPGPRGRPPGD